MENRTEFNLNNRVQNWKSELSRNSNMTIDNICELESHLYDEIEELQKLKLSPEESFLIAKNRIGNIQELTNEFSKINKVVYLRNMISPYLIGILFFMAFITATELLSRTALLFANKIGITNDNFYLVIIGLLIVLTSVISVMFYKKYHTNNFNLKKLINIPVLVISIGVGQLLSFIIALVLAQTITPHDFGILGMSLGYYQILIGFAIVIFSSVVFYHTRKEQRINITE